jgi:hypothetical protein
MATAIPLPAMDVEDRADNLPHTVPEIDNSDVNMCAELSKATLMNHLALNGPAWPEDVLNIIKEYCKLSVAPTNAEMKNAVYEVTKFTSWKQVCKFVLDDLATDFFNICLRYIIAQGAPKKDPSGFIGGILVRYVNLFMDRLEETMELCFNAKYSYKVRRPLVYSIEHNGMDLSRVAGAIHPGHWSYPAGHGTIYFTAVEVLNDLYTLTTQQYRNLFLAALVCANGRAGNLIHYPMDNDAGGYLTTLPEYAS